MIVLHWMWWVSVLIIVYDSTNKKIWPIILKASPMHYTIMESWRYWWGIIQVKISLRATKMLPVSSYDIFYQQINWLPAWPAWMHRPNFSLLDIQFNWYLLAYSSTYCIMDLHLSSFCAPFLFTGFMVVDMVYNRANNEIIHIWLKRCFSCYSPSETMCHRLEMTKLYFSDSWNMHSETRVI